jgi:hypothetical protein
LLALASCGPRDSSTGELNNGKFAYLCVNSGDASCDDAVSNHPIPDLLAVGGAFDLEYAGESAGNGAVQVAPASEVMISAASGHFKFLLPGVASVLARNTSGGVADFIHLHAARVDHLEVSDSALADALTTVEMTTNDVNVTLRATPKSTDNSLLSGALQYTWASSNENVVTLQSFGATNHTTLTGVGPGTATVVVSLPSGVKVSVLVTVTQGSNPTSSSSSGSSGQGGSGGSATTTTTTGAGGAGGGK